MAELTASQMMAILAIAEAFIPALTPAETAAATRLLPPSTPPSSSPASINEFLTAECTSTPEFRTNLTVLLSRLPPTAVRSLGKFLDLLHGGGLVAFLFTWSFSPFTRLPRVQRERILQGWRDSWFSASRSLFSSFKRLVLTAYLKSPPPAIGFPLQHAALRSAAAAGGSVLPGVHRFMFHTFLGVRDLALLEADVAIVGSGAGGGVVAAKLARLTVQGGRKLKVVVVDRGECVPIEQLPVEQTEIQRIYDGPSGAFTTKDGKGAILAGSTWGGSTTVNYSGSLELPDYVRKEWSEEHGLEFATTADFQSCFDWCKEMMGVSTTAIKHSTGNRLLIDGSRRCGLDCIDIPQNTAGHGHTVCGSFCSYGCMTGEKQGTAVSWLAEAERNGAICIQKCQVNEITFDGEKKATGLKATLLNDGVELRIRAKTVVVSAGSIRTPVLLMKSGIQHPALGMNLHVHPVSLVVGFINDRKDKGWEGTMMTAMASRPAPERFPYFPKVINLPVISGSMAPQLPWRSAAHWKASILRLEKSICYGSMTRDRDSGSVTADAKSGEPVISYALSAFDHANMVDGLLDACRIQLAGGCDEIQPVVDAGETITEPYVADPQTAVKERLYEPRFQTWLNEVEKAARSSKLRNWISAHPQGTCRMGGGAGTAVVDVEGRVRGYGGLYVADASLCPSATGVNPMLTTMALSEWVARRIADHLGDDSS